MSSRPLERCQRLLYTNLRRNIAPRPTNITRRHATTKSKPIVLEKPEKFNPPSHPSGRNIRRKPQYYGPALSQDEREAQKTKRYPHMMPPEGTLMYRFLTNRALHVYISLSVLFALGVLSFVGNFQRTSPYYKDVPPLGTVLFHPIQYIKSCTEIYKMHVAYISAQTAERRRKKVEDVQKMAEYRKAHGLDTEEGFGGWTARTSADDLGPGVKVPDREAPVPVNAGAPQDEKGVYTDFEGKKRPLKKWLGIW